jgi:hypothetical protein
MASPGPLSSAGATGAIRATANVSSAHVGVGTKLRSAVNVSQLNNRRRTNGGTLRVMQRTRFRLHCATGVASRSRAINAEVVIGADERRRVRRGFAQQPT